MSNLYQSNPSPNPSVDHPAFSQPAIEQISFPPRSGASVAPVAIRSLSSLSEMAEVMRLQREVWGFTETETIPDVAMYVLSKTGSQILGAFDAGGEMVGFSLSYLSRDHRTGEVSLYLDLIGVAPEYQSRSVGFMLHQEMKNAALAAGISKIEWTYDPMETKNANLYLKKLGGVVTAFYPNYYGDTQAELQRGLPTDRYHVIWNLRDAGGPTPFPDKSQALVNYTEGKAVVIDAALRLSDPFYVCAVPLNFQDLKKSDLDAARRLQAAISGVSERLTAAGYVASNFRVNGETGLGEYLFQRID